MQVELTAEIQEAADFAGIDLDADVGVSAIGTQQERVVVALAKLTTPDDFKHHIEGSEWLDYAETYSGESEGWVRYKNVTQYLVERADERSKASIQASVSRGLDGLIDRGMLEGTYRAWGFVRPPDKHGDGHVAGRHPWSDNYYGDEGDRPTLKWLRLLSDGWIAAYQLLRQRPEDFEYLLV